MAQFRMFPSGDSVKEETVLFSGGRYGGLKRALKVLEIGGKNRIELNSLRRLAAWNRSVPPITSPSTRKPLHYPGPVLVIVDDRYPLKQAGSFK